MHLQYFLSGSVYPLLIRRTIRPFSIRPQDFLSNIRTSACPSVNFHQLSVHLRYFPSTCVNFSCISGTFSQLSVHPWDFLSISVNSPRIHGTFCQLLSTLCASVGPTKMFRAAAGPSVNFSQLSVQPWDHLSTFRASTSPSVNFPSVRGTFRKHSLWLEDHPSTFLAFTGLSVNFRELPVCPRDSTSILHAFMGLSVNFCQLSVHPGDLCQRSLHLQDFRELLLPFCASAVPFIKFEFIRGIFRPLSCIRGTFCKLT